MGLFFAHRPAILLCRPLLVLVSARFIRDAAPVCEGVIFFTLSERPRTPSCPLPPIERTPSPPVTPEQAPSRRTVAFVCVGSMGIDILFPIVRAPSLSLRSPSLSSLPSTRPYSSPPSSPPHLSAPSHSRAATAFFLAGAPRFFQL